MIPTTDEPAASSGDAPGNAGPDDERRALLDELVRIHHAIGETFLSQRLEPLLHTRLTVQQLRALAILQLDGETSSHRLAEVMGVAPATVTGIVDRLVSAGMAARRPDPRDRRVRLVAATTRGADAVRRLVAQDDEPTHGLIERIATDDLQALSRGLTAVLAAARAEADAVRSADDAPEG
ncbi:MarR family winged helix-turn-helix transcriptional regulator [Isoptericola nanjingensis]|uniref:MarR family winged helix-turn-helix transcriptional regulator n=1 Tax=Isoptericola nanjingensis TaxID=903413 RepID=UPI003D197A7C